MTSLIPPSRDSWSSRSLRLLFMPLLALGFGLSTHAAEAQIVIVARWPANWLHAEPVKYQDAYTIQAEQYAGAVANQKLQLTIFEARSAPHGGDAQDIRFLAEQLLKGTTPLADEKSLSLLPFANGRGYFFQAAHKLEPGHAGPYFRQLVQGVWRCGDFVVNFSLLTHNAMGPDARTILTAIESAKIGEMSAKNNGGS